MGVLVAGSRRFRGALGAQPPAAGAAAAGELPRALPCAHAQPQKQGRTGVKKKVKVEGVKCKRKGLVEKGKKKRRGCVQKIVLILFLVLKIVFLSKNYEINSVRFI